MSHVTRSATLRQPPSPIEGDAEPGFVAGEVFDWLWRTFTSMRTALVLILALAALALLGTILVQAPAGLTSDQQAYAAWLQALKPKYGGFVPILDRLGLFSVFQSIWFRAILVGLVTSILACSVNRFRGLWKTAVRPRMRMTDRFFASAPYQARLETDVTPTESLDLTRAAFRAAGYRTVVAGGPGAADIDHLYVDRFRWSPFGTLIGHLSLVLILSGALVGSVLGYRNNEFAVTVGTTVPVGGGTAMSVMARSFSDSYYENGAPSDYASDLVVYRDGQELAAKTVRVNDPLSVDGVSFYQSFFGPAAVMRVQDAGGETVYEGGVPLMWSSDDATRRIGQFSLVDNDLSVYVVGAASGLVDPTIRPGEMQLEIYRPGDERPAYIQVVSQGEPLTIGDLSYTFIREQQFTGLIVSRDPGELLVWFGALALVGGLFLVFMFPNRRIWVAFSARDGGGSEVVMGATTRHDATFAPEFNKVVERVEHAFERARD